MRKGEKEYVKKLNSALRGRKILSVEYMSKKETKANYWHNSPIIIELENKGGNPLFLIPMADDEGNDGGAISTNFSDEELSTIAVWRN